jgi:aminopeptidase N
VQAAERVSGRELDAFFRVYLYQADLPVLTVNRKGTALTLSWTNTGGVPFDVPVPVTVDGETQRVDMPDGTATLTVPTEVSLQIDPKGYVLKSMNPEQP